MTSGSSIRHWVAGDEVTLDVVAWGVRAANFLGCAFDVRVPATASGAALAHARSQAADVARALGTELDEAPWRAAATLVGDLRLTGGWEHRFRGPLGTAATRIEERPSGPLPALRTAVGSVLPWLHPSPSPLSALAMGTTHEAAVAAAYLASSGESTGESPGESPGRVGLWLDHRGVLCTSTAGPVLLAGTDGNWYHPTPDLAPQHWLHSHLVEHLDSRAHEFRVEDVAENLVGTTLLALDAWGEVTWIRRPALGPPATTSGNGGNKAAQHLQAVVRQVLARP